MRAWATADPRAAAAVEAVDVERTRYLGKLAIEAGVHPNIAETRARIMNWVYLGFALSPNKPDDDALRLVIADLSQLARLRGGEAPRRPQATAKAARRKTRS